MDIPYEESEKLTEYLQMFDVYTIICENNGQQLPPDLGAICNGTRKVGAIWYTFHPNGADGTIPEFECLRGTLGCVWLLL